MTNKELVLVLLNRLIDLEVERIAMAGLLQLARVPKTGLPLDWHLEVRATHDQIFRDIVSGKYVETRQAIQESTPDCSNALSLLEKALKDLAQLDDL
jgi:hypothetical protein